MFYLFQVKNRSEEVKLSGKKINIKLRYCRNYFGKQLDRFSCDIISWCFPIFNKTKHNDIIIDF